MRIWKPFLWFFPMKKHKESILHGIEIWVIELGLERISWNLAEYFGLEFFFIGYLISESNLSKNISCWVFSKFTRVEKLIAKKAKFLIPLCLRCDPPGRGRRAAGRIAGVGQEVHRPFRAAAQGPVHGRSLQEVHRDEGQLLPGPRQTLHCKLQI